MKVSSYRDLIVWQKAVGLSLKIYDLTKDFPSDEKFGLTTQMRRAALSIASNIAEGSRRGTKKDFRNFILTANGSGAELETQIIIVKQLPFGQSLDYNHIDELLGEIMRMLNTLGRNLKV